MHSVKMCVIECQTVWHKVYLVKSLWSPMSTAVWCLVGQMDDIA